MLRSIGYALLVYCFVALVGFGSPFKPIFLLTIGSERLGAPYWQAIAAITTAAAATVLFVPRRWILPLRRLPTFVFLAMMGSILTVGLYANALKEWRLLAFDADLKMSHSFLRSLHEAPEDHQFFLHAAALKNCVPYGWSYRTMGFYQIPREAAINVLPLPWFGRCAFLRPN